MTMDDREFIQATKDEPHKIKLSSEFFIELAVMIWAIASVILPWIALYFVFKNLMVAIVLVFTWQVIGKMLSRVTHL